MSAGLVYLGGDPGPYALRVPGGACVLHGHGLTTTEYPGLPPLDAYPQDTEEYRARARELGYGDDTFALSRQHEIGHHLLAWLLGLPASPSLMEVARAAAESRPVRRKGLGVEEAAVIALQGYASRRGVDLVERARQMFACDATKKP